MAATGLEEKYDAVKQLIAIGKERGYLLYDEVNDSLPAEVHSSEEIDDLLTTFERNGIEIYEDAASAKAARAVEVSTESGERDAVVKDDGHAEEGSDLDLTPGSLEKTNDPVRMYLREMGTVPLLTREGEVTIAKRIERGQLVVMKAITRSPIVIKELIAVGDDLRKGARSIKEIVQFDDEELTEEKIANKTKQTLKHIDKIAKLYELALKQAVKLDNTAKSKKRPYIRAKWAVARTRIEISLEIRGIDFNPFEKKRLVDKIRGTVERLQSLEREAGRLERRADVSKGDNALEARRELRTRRSGIERHRRRQRGRPDRAEAHPHHYSTRRSRSRASQERIDRGQPSSRRFHRQEIHQSRLAIPGSDSGRQHRPDEGCGQVRVAPRLQVLHLCDLVDSPGYHPRHRRPGAHHPYSGAHDRDHQQTRAHQPPACPGTRPRAHPEEIAKRMDIPVDKVRKILKIAQEPISLETPIGEEEDSHLGDFIEDKAVVSPSDAVISLNLKEQTSSVLKTLTPREEKVIKMRFGLDDGSEHTLEEVGQSFAVTRERIRQIEAKALRKLRHPSRSRKLRAFLEGPSRDYL